MPGGQQVQLGPSDHQALACVEHLPHMAGVGSNGGHPDQRSSVQLQVPGLGRRDFEASPEFGDHRPEQRALLLQGANVAEKDVQFNSADVHHSPPVGSW